ncbi:hypothetical protein NHX12_011559, partial [Muraenolepis orangiensis]
MERLDTVQLYEDVSTEVVESCCTLQEVTSPKKRRSKAQDDFYDKPKKPRSAYLLYYFDFHPVIQQESPNLPQSEINKRISESWKRLNVAEKGYYLEKAKLEREGVDTSSVSSTQDLSGFRKILPRANYILLSKGSPSGDQAVGGSQPEPSTLRTLGPLGTSSVTLFPHLALDSDVEFAEQCVAIEGLAEETASISGPSELQGALTPSTACPALSQSSGPASHDSRVVPVPCAPSCGMLLAAGDPGVVGNDVYSFVKLKLDHSVSGGAMVQPMKRDISQVVTMIPAQNLVDPKSVACLNSVCQVMMVSVGAGVKQTSKPSYKMAVKAYTMRGRGRCLAPDCSFVYMTRHKPPKCPQCGNHLGGKWVPTAKKTAKQSRQLNQKPESNSIDGDQPVLSSSEEGNSTAGIENVKRGQFKQSLKKQHKATKGEPLEGGSTKTQTPARQLKRAAKGITVKGQDKSHVTMKTRPVRPILPAYCTSGRAVLQFITVPPDKGKTTCNNLKSVVTVPSQSMSGLKPSTLKQLGHMVPAAAAAAATVMQSSTGPAEGSQFITSLNAKGVNILSVVPLKQNVSSFDLGLSTARGRGRCKNPSCDYMYKNRHKPAECPKCGWGLSSYSAKGVKAPPLLDPYRALSPAQRNLQRLSTLKLMRRVLQIPEGEAELQETLALIQDLNGPQVVLSLSGEGDDGQDGLAEAETAVQSGWPRYYESAATHCSLCQYPLFKGGQNTVAGQEDCWLLTESLIQTASLQLKVCLNTQCLALHSFTDLHAGLFNIGNKLLVSLDLFLKVRDKLRLGHHPSEAAGTILDHIPNHPVHALSPVEMSHVHDLLLSGYWAFESLTVRDYNDMICGVCGVAPTLEVAQRFSHNALELNNVQFTWPEFSGPDEVHVEDFWLTMESETIEQAAFPSDIPVTQMDASIVAPFIPPLMRSAYVINTEKNKLPADTLPPAGDPAVLVRLIHEGQLRLDTLEDHQEDELRAMLQCCGETPAAREELLGSLLSLYAHIQSGLSTGPQPPPHRTAGKLSKVCPHKVVCGSKYLVRGETARDHLDLLLSSRYWPPVYVTDGARPVALCADVRYPQLAGPMWGRNQGCFSDPLDKPQLVSCAELQEQLYGAQFSSPDDDPLLHPVTRSSSRWLVHPRAGPALDHHSMGLRDIVSRQIGEVLGVCQPGEVVIRDALYRLGVAQINTELEDAGQAE